jgi:2-methylisocitrate lyase-like PEP mutase family enzyme
MTVNHNQRERAERFQELHQSGCFVLPNPWDAGSAVYLEELGFKAIASTSAGFAYSRALPDSPQKVPVTVVFDHLSELVAATSIPVNADFQNGFADGANDVARNVMRCVETGVAGLSIEDSTGNDNEPFYSLELAVERIKAARAAIDAANVPVVLTARCEAYLVGTEDKLNFALERLTAFAEAGADCLYAPGIRDLAGIEAIVKAVAPKPVNVLVSSPHPNLTLARLAELGVRRISVGSALFNVAWDAFIRSARSIAETGAFDGLKKDPSFPNLNDLFEKRLK